MIASYTSEFVFRLAIDCALHLRAGGSPISGMTLEALRLPETRPCAVPVFTSSSNTTYLFVSQYAVTFITFRCDICFDLGAAGSRRNAAPVVVAQCLAWDRSPGAPLLKRQSTGRQSGCGPARKAREDESGRVRAFFERAYGRSLPPLRQISSPFGNLFPRGYDGLPIFTPYALPYTGLENREREEVTDYDTQRRKRDKRRLLLEER
jgi:hypothetical protein